MRLFRVGGDSMAPALRDGDFVLTVKAAPRSLRSGRIFVLDHSDLGIIIKRMTGKNGDGRYWFKGDNPNSTPQSIIAPVEYARIRARAVFVIGRAGICKL